MHLNLVATLFTPLRRRTFGTLAVLALASSLGNNPTMVQSCGIK